MSTTHTSNDAKQTGGYIKEKFVIGMTRWNDDEVQRALMKCTSHKLKAPNEKHMVRLLAATHGSFNAGKSKYDDVNKFIVDELEQRLHTHSWIIVLKTLVTLHRLMSEGGEAVVKRIDTNRNLFCLRHQKELADSIQAAIQARFVEQYTRYLEERSCCSHRLGANVRWDSNDFLTALENMDADVLLPAYETLLQAAEALAEIEYADDVVDNAASHDAFSRILMDSARLYVVLGDRLMFVMTTFECYPTEMKEKWLKTVERTVAMHRKLKKLFDSMRSSKIVFESDIPVIDMIPQDVIKRMRDELQFSSVPKERLESIVDKDTLAQIRSDESSPRQEQQRQLPPQPQAQAQPSLLGDVEPVETKAAPPMVTAAAPAPLAQPSFSDLFAPTPQQQQQQQPVSQPPTQSQRPQEIPGFAPFPTATPQQQQQQHSQPTQQPAQGGGVDLFGGSSWGQQNNATGAGGAPQFNVGGAAQQQQQQSSAVPGFAPFPQAGTASPPPQQQQAVPAGFAPFPTAAPQAQRAPGSAAPPPANAQIFDPFAPAGTSAQEAQARQQQQQQAAQRPAEFDPFATAPPPQQQAPQQSTQQAGMMDFFNSSPPPQQQQQQPAPFAAQPQQGGRAW